VKTLINNLGKRFSTARLFALIQVASLLVGGSLVVGGAAATPERRTPLGQADPAEVALQAALHVEHSEGDLARAIEMYREIVARHGSNREVAAKALVRTGICLEKLGQAEARAAYEQVLSDYADQTEVAAEARSRLASLDLTVALGAGEGLVVNRIWAGSDVPLIASVSPDGRYLAYTDWKTSDLAVIELATNEKRYVTKAGPWSETREYAESPLFSPDGTRIAYSWNNNDDDFGLRVVGLDDTEPSIVYRQRGIDALAADWSPDGKHILARLTNDEGVSRLVSISVEEQSVRTLRTFGKDRPPVRATYSPDGEYVAYDYPQEAGALERDIYLLTADGSSNAPLVEGPTNDYLLGWDPSGTGLLFVSDRSGTLDAWSIEVSEGTPRGAPVRVRRDIGQVLPLGFTRDGSFYYSLDTRMEDVFIAAIDPATGAVLEPPKNATRRFVGSSYSPTWSSDGKYLAYVSDRAPVARLGGTGNRALCIRSLDTETEREIFQPRVGRALSWSPDSQSILALGRDRNQRRGIVLIDTESGEATLVVERPAGGFVNPWPAWSRDGRAILYTPRPSDREVRRILMRDLETGEEREIYRFTAEYWGREMSISPDGERLLIVESASGEKPSRLMLLTLSGGEPRELLSAPAQGWITSADWSADGAYILFISGGGVSTSNTPQPGQLWRVPAGGGAAERLDSQMDRINALRVSPDGRHVAFTTRPFSAEIWMMKNFLP